MSVKGRFLATTLLILAPLSRPAIGATIGFKPAQSYSVGPAPAAVAAADFNGDGNVDLAVANNGNASAGDDGNVSILLGNGDGTFQAAVNHAAGRNPTAVAAGDFNGDGRKDLVVASSSSPTVSVLLGNGDGTFQTPVDYAAGLTPLRGLAVGDFNGDNQADLAVVWTVFVAPIDFDTTVTVLLGNGNGSFQTPVDYPLGVITGAAFFGGFPQGLAAVDLNGDGESDLAAATRQGVAILPGTGTGSFLGATLVSAAGSGSVLSVVVGDFTGDGHPDLVVSRFGIPGNSALLLNNGDGTFATGNSVAVGSVVGDFDGDGKLDLAGFTEDCPHPLVDPCTNPRLAVLPGNGNGTFQPEVSFPGDIHPFLAGDLDGNKSPDLISVNGGSTISVLLNAVGAEFSIAASAASPATVSRGQSSTSSVTLHLLNAFDNPVALACSVQPAQAAPTCSLNPSSVAFDASGNATAMLTINTGAAVASLTVPDAGRDPWPAQFLWLPVTGFALVGAGLRRGVARRRRLLNLLASGILLAGLMLETGCGGGSSSVDTSTGPSSQTYTVTVTGTSGSVQHSTTVTLSVQ